MPTLTLQDGSNIVYDEAGSGSPALLMVHGFTGGRWYYENDLPVFSEKYRCIAPDLVGHGDSDKPTDRTYSVAQFARDVEEISRALKLDRFVFVGHSMGGMIAQTYALDHNADGRCIGLILISTAPVMMLRDAIAASNRKEISLYEKGEWRSNEKVRRSLARVAWSDKYADAHPDQVERAYQGGLRVPDIARMRLMLAMAEEYDVSARLGEINLPTLACVGTNDLLAEGTEKLAQAIPDARFRKSEGIGHMINIEAPQAIQKEISDFLSEEIL